MQNLLGFDRLLPDDDCLIAIKILSAPHLLPYIFVVEWGSRSRLVASSWSGRGQSSKERGRTERPYSSLPEPDTFETIYFLEILSL
jgi:hypothetical protein